VLGQLENILEIQIFQRFSLEQSIEFFGSSCEVEGELYFKFFLEIIVVLWDFIVVANVHFFNRRVETVSQELFVRLSAEREGVVRNQMVASFDVVVLHFAKIHEVFGVYNVLWVQVANSELLEDAFN
jgi:hypothetical protein